MYKINQTVKLSYSTRVPSTLQGKSGTIQDSYISKLCGTKYLVAIVLPNYTLYEWVLENDLSTGCSARTIAIDGEVWVEYDKNTQPKPELKFGEYALMGKEKAKRIYLGFDGKKHHAVFLTTELDFNKGKTYKTCQWDLAEPMPTEVNTINVNGIDYVKDTTCQ